MTKQKQSKSTWLQTEGTTMKLLLQNTKENQRRGGTRKMTSSDGLKSAVSCKNCEGCKLFALTKKDESKGCKYFRKGKNKYLAQARGER